MREERPGALLARRTRTMKLCSSDARSKGQPWPLLKREVERIGRAPFDGRSGTNTGAIPREGKQASLEGACEGRLDGLLCSRNARSRTPLVRRAHSRINQATL